MFSEKIWYDLPDCITSHPLKHQSSQIEGFSKRGTEKNIYTSIEALLA